MVAAAVVPSGLALVVAGARVAGAVGSLVVPPAGGARGAFLAAMSSRSLSIAAALAAATSS